jgi:hypothetical protein
MAELLGLTARHGRGPCRGKPSFVHARPDAFLSKADPTPNLGDAADPHAQRERGTTRFEACQTDAERGLGQKEDRP